MDHLGITETALFYFYGIFWATTLGSISAFKPFDTASIFRGRTGYPAVRRAFVCLVVANALPVFGIWYLYQLLHNSVPSEWGVPIAALASLSVFSLPRLIHGIVLNNTTATWFYLPNDLERVQKDNNKMAEPFYYHLVPGVVYIGIPIGLAHILVAITTT